MRQVFSRIIAGILLIGLGVSPSLAVDRCRAERDAVVLLHGLGRTPRSMSRLEEALVGAGYEVYNVGYPSRKLRIEDLALDLDAAIEACCRGRDRYAHFVTHSLGGIVLRYYLKRRPLDNVGRVVMLSPPNAGSEIVDLMRLAPILKDHIGPARGQLGTRRDDPPTALGGVNFELGVIAGDRGVIPPLSWMIPGKDDGIVAVDRTRVEGMSDFVVLPRAHSFIMRGADVIGQTRAFLETGRFDPIDLPGFARVDAGIFRGGQPGENGIEELAGLGIKTILNLRREPETVAEERARAEAAGLRFIHVPLAPLGRPDHDSVSLILGHLTDPTNQPIFVHCKRGADRTGMIVACFRILRQGWSAERAIEEAREMGLGWWQDGLNDFIDDACGAVVEDLPPPRSAAQTPAAAPRACARAIGSAASADGSVKIGVPAVASKAIFPRSSSTQPR